MECTTCVPPSGRRDKPHTFFAHEFTTCGGCGAALEGRVVLRDGDVVMLKLCPACGPTEDRSRPTPRPGWPPSSRAARSRTDSPGDHLFKHTTSTCPTCLALVAADVVIRAGRVYFKKACATCGPSEALVSEDAALLRARLRLRARRHRAAQVRAPTSSTAARPTAAPATTTSSTPACRSSRSPITATSSARSASSTTSTRTTCSPRRSRASSTGWSPTKASANRSRSPAASPPATRGSWS